MNRLRVVNLTRNILLGGHVMLADRWWRRLRGFLGRPEPRVGEGILLSPCRSVHMWGMPYPLDVVFVDGAGMVVAIYPLLQPGTRTRLERWARHALELPSGTVGASGTTVGDRVVWTPATERVQDSNSTRTTLEVPVDLLLRASDAQGSEVR